MRHIISILLVEAQSTQLQLGALPQASPPPRGRTWAASALQLVLSAPLLCPALHPPPALFLRFSCSSPSQVSFLTRWRRRRAQELGPTLISVPATASGACTGSGSVPVSGARAVGDSVGLQPSGRALG